MGRFDPFMESIFLRTAQRSCSFLLLAGLNLVSHAQITWRRTYGGYGIDDAHSVRQTADGGYIIAGTTGSFGNGASDIYVIRVDEYGIPIWSHTYGGPGVDIGIACRELPDGYIIAGSTATGSHGSYDMVLIRTDEQGMPLWEKNYGTEDWDLCNALDVLPDGFVLGGISYGDGMQNGAAYIARTNLNGDTLWTRMLGGDYRQECNGLTHTTDQGIVVAGSIGTNSGFDDALLAKLDQNGQEQWVTPIGGDSNDVFMSATVSMDGHITACGSSRSQSSNSKVYLASVDAGGQFLWEQLIGNTADAGGSEIRNDHGNGFVFTGYNTLNFGEKDMIITKVDMDGWFQSGYNYGNGQPADGFSIDPTADGGYVTAGWAENYGSGIRDVYVVKSDSMGYTGSLNVTSYFDPLPVDEVERDEGGMLWPNVLGMGEDLHLRRTGKDPDAHARILDLQGAVVADLALPQQEMTLHLPDLAPGLYFLSVVAGAEVSRPLKFMMVR